MSAIGFLESKFMVTMLVVSDNYCLSEGIKHIVYCNGLRVRVRVSKFKEVIGERGGQKNILLSQSMGDFGLEIVHIL